MLLVVIALALYVALRPTSRSVTTMATGLVGFGLYLPTVGVAISAFSGLILWVWYLLIARKFLQLRGPMAHVPGPSGT